MLSNLNRLLALPGYNHLTYLHIFKEYYPMPEKNLKTPKFFKKQ